MIGDGRSVETGGQAASDSAQARRKLLKSRFSVFDGGGDGSVAGERTHQDREENRPLGLVAEQPYHSECYACPVGKAFRGVSQAAQSEAFDGVLDALAELIRTGTRLLETIATKASGAGDTGCAPKMERITVE